MGGWETGILLTWEVELAWFFFRRGNEQNREFPLCSLPTTRRAELACAVATGVRGSLVRFALGALALAAVVIALALLVALVAVLAVLLAGGFRGGGAGGGVELGGGRLGVRLLFRDLLVRLQLREQLDARARRRDGVVGRRARVGELGGQQRVSW